MSSGTSVCQAMDGGGGLTTAVLDAIFEFIRGGIAAGLFMFAHAKEEPLQTKLVRSDCLQSAVCGNKGGVIVNRAVVEDKFG